MEYSPAVRCPGRLEGRAARAARRRRGCAAGWCGGIEFAHSRASSPPTSSRPVLLTEGPPSEAVAKVTEFSGVASGWTACRPHTPGEVLGTAGLHGPEQASRRGRRPHRGTCIRSARSSTRRSPAGRRSPGPDQAATLVCMLQQEPSPRGRCPRHPDRPGNDLLEVPGEGSVAPLPSPPLWPKNLRRFLAGEPIWPVRRTLAERWQVGVAQTR